MSKVGLIGYGLAGAIFHEPLIRACDGLDLCAVVTSRDHPLRANSLEELLQESDLVVIATPNATHFPLAKRALESGKHVVVDKPFTVTTSEADELISLAARQERMLTVFHNRRWDGDFLTVRRLVPELGDIMLYDASWDRFRPAIKRGWREEAEPGSGLLSDLGPHLVDQALQLFGMPDSISADLLAQRNGAMVDDYFDLTLHYGRARVRLSSSTLVAEPRPRFAVHGTAGSFVKHGLDPQESQLKSGLDPRDPAFGIDPSNGRRIFPDGRSEQVQSEQGRYLAFYEGVAEAIRDGSPAPVDAGDARRGLMLIDLARRAAAQGKRLAVPGASSTEG